MGDPATDNGKRRPQENADVEDQSSILAAEIVVAENEIAECTVFAPDAIGFERRTTWMTAKEGSFVDLDDTR